jgi:hypothetical protein
MMWLETVAWEDTIILIMSIPTNESGRLVTTHNDRHDFYEPPKAWYNKTQVILKKFNFLCFLCFVFLVTTKSRPWVMLCLFGVDWLVVILSIFLPQIVHVHMHNYTGMGPAMRNRSWWLIKWIAQQASKLGQGQVMSRHVYSALVFVLWCDVEVEMGW